MKTVKTLSGEFQILALSGSDGSLMSSPMAVLSPDKIDSTLSPMN